MSDQHYRVSIGTYDIDLEELHHPAGAAPISFVPVVAGAGAVGRILLAGIALIAAFFCISWTRYCCRCESGGLKIGATGIYLIGLRVGFLGASLAFRRRRATPNTHAKDQQRRR
jgi:predicted phage tail protein